MLGLPACTAAPSPCRQRGATTTLTGLPACTISMAPARCDDDDIREEAAGMQRGAIFTISEARRRRVRAKAASVQRGAILSTSDSRDNDGMAGLLACSGAIPSTPASRDDDVQHRRCCSS